MRPTFHKMTSYLSECQFSKLQNEDERLQMEEQTSDDQWIGTMLVPQPSHHLAALPLGAGRYAFVPGQLAGMAGGDTWAEGYISAWNTVPLCTPQSVHSPAARETCLGEGKEVYEPSIQSHLSGSTTMGRPRLGFILSSLLSTATLGKAGNTGLQKRSQRFEWQVPQPSRLYLTHLYLWCWAWSLTHSRHSQSSTVWGQESGWNHWQLPQGLAREPSSLFQEEE